MASTDTPARTAPLKIDIHAHILPETWPDFEAVCLREWRMSKSIRLSLLQLYGYGGFIKLEHHKPV